MIKCLNSSIFFLGFVIALSALASAKVNTKICRKKDGLFPKPGSLCKGYYKCIKFVPYELVCPPEHHFSTMKLRCDWMELVPCLEKPKRKECPTADGKFLKPRTECIYYYDCCNGTPTEKKCPKGHLFDPSKQRCELETHYTCIESISTEGPTNRITESTSEEIVPPATTIIDLTSEEISHSTASTMESTSEEVPYSTNSIRESTPDERVSSSIEINESTPDKIVYSTASTRESTSEEVPYSTNSIRESTPDERVSSSIGINESTPEEITYFTTSIPDSTTKEVMSSTMSTHGSSPEEISDSTTSIGETTSDEEIRESTTLIGETTFEQSTTPTVETNDRTTISEEVSFSTEYEHITNEPNIMCPEPFGYYPHPTDKHKFVGCVDNIPTVLTCPSDLIYDHEHRQCVYQ